MSLTRNRVSNSLLYSVPSSISLSVRSSSRGPVHTRSFSVSSSSCSGSPLFNLTGLANSRETQHFSRERRIPRTEFSPQLQLLRASEVDPFAPAPGASAGALARAKARSQSQTTLNDAATGQKMFVVGTMEAVQAEAEVRRLQETQLQVLGEKISKLELRLLENKRENERGFFFLIILGVGGYLVLEYKDEVLEKLKQDLDTLGLGKAIGTSRVKQSPKGAVVDSASMLPLLDAKLEAAESNAVELSPTSAQTATQKPLEEMAPHVPKVVQVKSATSDRLVTLLSSLFWASPQ